MTTEIIWFALGAYGTWTVYRMFAGKVSSVDARKLVAEGAALVDVRSTGEFASRHLDGAINIPVGEIAGRTAEIGAKDRPVVVYCASGARSASAAGILRKAGFEKVVDLGSIARW